MSRAIHPKDAAEMQMPQKRISLIIRDAGLGSRRKAEDLIRERRVTLNGMVVESPGVTADPEKDHIKVDGKLIRRRETSNEYYLLNKPRFVVSTMSDPEGRQCIGDLVKPLSKGLFAVGRLDFDAEGLMILTNDGALAQKLGHPSNRMPRVYMVKVRGTPDAKQLAMIRKGMGIGDGDRVGDIEWSVIKTQKTTTWIRLTLYEGKKNEVKRIFYRIGHPVRKLRRIAFGPFSLGKVPSGAWRPLTPAEINNLQSLLHTEERP